MNNNTEKRPVLNSTAPAIPEEKELRRQVHRYILLGRFRLILAGLITAAVFLVPVFRDGPEAAFRAVQEWTGARTWLLIVLVGLLLILTGLQKLQFSSPEHTALKDTPRERLGSYSADDLETILDEVRAALDKQNAERPALFITKSSQSIAMTVNYWLMDHKPRLNAVYLSETILRQLDRDELKAIIAHECAHFYQYMSPHGEMPIFTWILAIFVFLGAGPVLLDDLGGSYFTKWYHFLTALPGIIGIRILITGFKMSMEKGYEYLADLEGARIAGPPAMINTLLKIGSRQQLFFHLFQVLENILAERSGKGKQTALLLLESVMPREECTVAGIREKLAKELEKQTAGVNGIRRRRNWRRMARTLDRELSRNRRERDLDSMIEWHNFDTNIKDGRLDEVELRELLKTLREQPDSSLFNLTIDKKTAAVDVHPKIRERILFIAANSGL